MKNKEIKHTKQKDSFCMQHSHELRPTFLIGFLKIGRLSDHCQMIAIWQPVIFVIHISTPEICPVFFPDATSFFYGT